VEIWRKGCRARKKAWKVDMSERQLQGRTRRKNLAHFTRRGGTKEIEKEGSRNVVRRKGGEGPSTLFREKGS